jgi:hypothetical protein
MKISRNAPELNLHKISAYNRVNGFMKKKIAINILLTKLCGDSLTGIIILTPFSAVAR